MADLGLDASPFPIEIVDDTNGNELGINSDKSLNTNGSNKATYAASIISLTVATTPTDIFTITGSATKTIRVLRFDISSTATTEAVVNVVLLKRSTANSAGTSTTQVAVPHDSSDPAATAVIRAYTANPTLGTLVGNMQTLKLIATTTGPGQPGNTEFRFYVEDSGKPWILRGTGEILAINLNGATLVGNNFNIDVIWTEE